MPPICDDGNLCFLTVVLYRSRPSKSCGNADGGGMAREGKMLKASNPVAPSTAEPFDDSPPWLETQAEVTACHYVFARMNTLTLGIATDANHFRISYTYYAHATTYRDEFTSTVAMERGKTFPIFYNPLNPQQNRQSIPGAASASRGPLFALGIAGSIVISLVYVAMIHGCN
jgi:hypothetical protein